MVGTEVIQALLCRQRDIFSGVFAYTLSFVSTQPAPSDEGGGAPKGRTGGRDYVDGKPIAGDKQEILRYGCACALDDRKLFGRRRIKPSPGNQKFALAEKVMRSKGALPPWDRWVAGKVLLREPRDLHRLER